MRFTRFKTLIHLLFALLLALAQAHLMVHSADLDEHAEEESCEICIHYLNLEHPTPSDFGWVQMFSGKDLYQPASYSTIDTISFYPTPPSRASPVPSLR